MRTYWFKIIFGALVIFAGGMVVRWVIRQVSHKVNSADSITIPLPFGIVPFKLDRARLGTVKSVTLLRDSPKGISGFQIRVELADSVGPEALEGCMLKLEDPANLSDKTTFTCLKADTAGLGLVPYGTVLLQSGGEEFVLLIPEQDVRDLRHDEAAVRIENHADSIAEAASRLADSMAELADSVTQVNLERADSIREEALQRADSIREAGLRMADSIRRARAQ